MKKKLYVLFLSLALIFTSGINVYADEGSTKRFDVVAEVFDYGESVTGLMIDMGELVSSQDVDKDTFKVTARNLKQDDGIYYEGDVIVDDVKVVEKEEISAPEAEEGKYVIIALQYGYGNLASDSIYYNLVTDENGDFDFFNSFNLEMKLNYQITQTKDIGTIKSDTTYYQRQLIRPIVDQFEKKTSKNGLNYREFKPTIEAESYPLIVWFHGSGEGGSNNSSHILANKGGVGFANDEAQRIFNGAYVIAPQCPDNWAVGSKNYVPDALALIKETLAAHTDIDADRVLIAGCSAGASMTWMTFLAEPELFAAVVPVCGPEIDKEELQKVVDTPIWMIHSQDDPTVPYEYSLNNYNNLKALGGNVHLTTYDNVMVGETEYNGHWSWIYALNNDPQLDDGTSLFAWMAKQTLISKETVIPVQPEPVVDTAVVTSPKTGDETSIYIPLGILSMSLISYLYLKKEYI